MTKEIVSHWRVDSESAVKLTTSTFGALQNIGIGQAEGLRRALLAMIDDSSKLGLPTLIIGQRSRSSARRW